MAEEIDDDVLEEVKEDKAKSDEKVSPIKKLLSNRIVLISIIAVFVALIAIGSYFLFFTSSDESLDEAEPTTQTETEQSSEQNNDEITSPESDNTLALPEINDEMIQAPAQENASSPPASPPPAKPSRLSQISSGMVEAAKSGGIASDNSTSSSESGQSSSDTSQQNNDADSLTKKIAALEEENKNLKDEISKLEIQIKLFKNLQRVEALSVPIDKIGADSSGSSTSTYNDGVNRDFSHDYSASPYADDSMTPKPTWGNNKPEVKK